MASTVSNAAGALYRRWGKYVQNLRGLVALGFSELLCGGYLVAVG